MQPFLVLHLAGAAVALGLISATVVVLVTRRTSAFRPLAYGVAAIGVYQIVTGALLSYAAGSTLLSFCARVGAYLAILGTVEVVLLLAAKRSVHELLYRGGVVGKD